MSQRRQEARRAERERRRQQRREQRMEQRRLGTVGTGAGASTTAVRARGTGRTVRRRWPWIVAGVAAGAVLALVIVFIVRAQMQPLPGQKFPTNGNAHVLPGEAHGAYFSNPPTSGWHYDTVPAPSSEAYTEPLAPEALPHFMEHGGVWVLYRPDVSDDVKQQLKAIVDKYLARKKPVALAPYPPPGYPQPEHPINVIAWQYLLGLDSVDRKQIEEFIERHACRYTPEGTGAGNGCPRGVVRGQTAPAVDAGEGGFKVPTPTAAQQPTSAAGPSTPAAVGPTPPAATATPSR